jgi:branched-chain amino acid transport system ATP-binding protein
MLELNNVNTYYGDSHVLFDVCLEVDEGEVIALLGRNGAGKTTTLRSISGVKTPQSGEIKYKNKQISGQRIETIYKQGIGYIPEDRRIFPDLTVRENLVVGLGSGQDTEEAFDRVFEYFPRLQERLSQKGGTLSGGEQQMLAIGRVLVSSPELLLIDEPTEGLMPTLVETISDIIEQLNDAGHTILLVEQNMNMALNIADRAYIMSKGEVVHSGTAEDVQRNEEIIEEFLTV